MGAGVIRIGWRYGNQLVVDGYEAGDWLRAEPCTVYVTGSIPVESTSIMQRGDVATGRPGTIQGITLRCDDKGQTRIMQGDVWGIRDETPDGLREKLTEIQSVCDEHGIEFRPTSAQTTVKLLDEFVDLKCTPPRYRQLMHAGLHAGPMTHVKPYAPWAAYMDVKSAYLDALYQPMPSGGWYMVNPRKRNMESLLSKPGMIACTVGIVDTPHTLELSPCPVKMRSGRMYYPTGVVRGVWPTTMLVPAIQRGEVEVLEIHYIARPRRLETLFDEFADFIQTVPRIASKPLYTRLWGKLSSRGWWKATRERPVGGGARQNGLWWQYQPRLYWKPGAPKWYCPDLSAWIVAHNHAHVVQTTRALQPGSLIACHVDSVFTTDVEGARVICDDSPGIGEWKFEGEGEVRYYAQGRYSVLGLDFKRFGYNGIQDIRPTDPDEFERLCLDMHCDEPRSRRWSNDPTIDPGAVSSPPYIDDHSRLQDPIHGLCPTDRTVWNGRGYPHDDVLRYMESERRKQEIEEDPLSEQERRDYIAELRAKNPNNYQPGIE